jgi:beta-glucanase (GH16 family)
MDRPHELPEGWPSRASVKGTIIIRTEGSTRRAKLLRRYWAVVAAMVALAGMAVLPGIAGTHHDLPSSTMTVGAAAPGSGPLGIPGTWNLELDSEFNGSSLNTRIWQTGWFGSGVTSPANTHEEDCYSPSNVTFPGDGTMHLSVTKAQSTCGGNTYPYTGSMITTNPDDGRASGGYQFTYGVVEALVYLPPSASSTIANWPAVWADGQTWPADGEDDILEGLDGSACFHFHYASSSGSEVNPGACVTGNFSGWHTFAVNWEKGSVTYYYDGTRVGQITTGVTSDPMYLILDNTIGTAEGPIVTPSDFQVSYVKVWQQS